MRSVKLIAAGVVAAASLTLAPAIASASDGHGSHRFRHLSAGVCRATLNVAPRLITAGEAVVGYGRLSCATAAEEEGQHVKLYQGSVPPGYTVAGETTTEKGGFYKVEVAHLNETTTFHAVVGTALSRSKVVRVAPQVTLGGPPEGKQLVTGRGAGAGNRVTFTGTVSPEEAGATVVLQRQDAITGNEWHRIQRGHVGAGGIFAITHTFLLPGDANIRVLVRAFHHRRSSPSNVLTYAISQAQNPSLTIDSSLDPITYGQSVGISGTVASAPGATVKLMARSAHQSAFAPIAEVKADSSGKYEFPAQIPVYNTFYKVESDGRTSAMLYQLVYDGLTATVSPGTSIQAGQALTFSGSVSPAHPGHEIYLERENASGTGFHTVEVSTLSAGSTYTIVHTVYTPGTYVFRIRITGDPENGGAVSQPFTITVAPASSSAALTPEAPGNSTLPSEGQV
jgi:hypothetical protein